MDKNGWLLAEVVIVGVSKKGNVRLGFKAQKDVDIIREDAKKQYRMEWVNEQIDLEKT
ncbi:Carbon storage regulator [uncultured Caudovirales phage]|uniref:Carbon storage regulator n=1 Tax=uncultured Caudovirales phage TaxID=2100421 RepID=A0A6J7XL49_9CAUD|nr:Carbon storage regulator [uncultured Caudovirales phage]